MSAMRVVLTGDNDGAVIIVVKWEVENKGDGDKRVDGQDR
jgi:hypothetical protein